MRYLFCLLVLIACKQTTQNNLGNNQLANRTVTVAVGDSLLRFNNGIWWYNNQLFSGALVQYSQDKIIQTQQTFRNGREQGWGLVFYNNRSVESKRYYINGEKDSIHLGWWLNGNKRFEYHFKQGNYHGNFKEWYESGELYKHIVYHNGNEIKGFAWRKNGKLYLNYIMRNGRRFGLINSDLCYSLKDERGEYVESIKEDASSTK